MDKETISLIADICGILGFLISLFVAAKVIQITKNTRINSHNNRQDANGNSNRQSITNR